VLGDQYQQPQFYEELRRIREQLAAEYDGKLKASIKELDEYKQEMEASQHEN
jgi:hypothetical protein